MKCRRFDGSEKDKELIHNICFNCGSTVMKRTFGYIERMMYFDSKKCVFDIFDESAFFFGVRGKKHLRCIGIAVMKSQQRQGIGRNILYHEMRKAKLHELNRMTLRTAKDETGIEFWLKMGATIVERKDTYWEMILNF